MGSVGVPSQAGKGSVAFEQRQERSEGASHIDIWEKNIPFKLSNPNTIIKVVLLRDIDPLEDIVKAAKTTMINISVNIEG